MTIAIGRTALALAVAGLLFTPARAMAQADKTEVDIAPFYFWATKLSGHVVVDDQNEPVFLDFRDATKNLAGAFSLHGEARRGRWGVLGDIVFARLSTDAAFTTPALGVPVTGTLQMDTIIFEGGVTYLVAPKRDFALIGGVRTDTLAPNLHFTAANSGTQLANFDESRTAAGVFGG